METQLISLTDNYLALEKKYAANDYKPIPVVLEKGKGVYVWDVEGKKYYDFLSAYSAVNQGHCHPRIIESMKKQADILTLASRAFHNNQFGKYVEYITKYFGFEKLLPMNTGAESVETAVKITRKWGYLKKNIPNNKAQIVVCNNNFHGRTTTIISFSTDEGSKNYFGPHTPGFIHIPFNDLDALEKVLNENPNIAGFLVEPIQGEAGVYTPDENFIPQAKEICQKHNVLLIADEIQTGLGRTGALLAICGNCSCEAQCERQTTYTKPDILILGKALSGGAYPISAVLCNSAIMDVIQPQQHGSTFGGNPMAASIAITSLEVIKDEKLAQNARKLGVIFREKMKKYIQQSNIVESVRGKGLLNAIVINDNTKDKNIAWNICLRFKEKGLLAKPTHGNIIRFAPPLVITEEQLNECIAIIQETLKEFER